MSNSATVLSVPRGEPAGSTPRIQRLLALDWMRGLVMILMTIDHASTAFNAGHLRTDSAFQYKAGMLLPTGQFFARWITHICAPTFLFLAGVSLALSVNSRIAKGTPAAEIDRHLLIRGLLLMAVDPLWFSLVEIPGGVILQVMYAIGLSMICMIPLRRLRIRWILTIATLLIVGGELLFYGAMTLGRGPTIPAALIIGLGIFFDKHLVIIYPVLPWLAMMLTGWAFGHYLIRARSSNSSHPRNVERFLLGGGLAALTMFLAVRGLNGYGNMLLRRDDFSLIQWLHVSKYPPSLTYTTLELGLAALILAGFFRLQRSGLTSGSSFNPLLVFGQTSLFFYLLHAHLLMLAARGLGVYQKMGLTATFLSTLATLIVLYPLCHWYRSYKASHPSGWTQYV